MADITESPTKIDLSVRFFIAETRCNEVHLLERLRLP